MIALSERCRVTSPAPALLLALCVTWHLCWWIWDLPSSAVLDCPPKVPKTCVVLLGAHHHPSLSQLYSWLLFIGQQKYNHSSSFNVNLLVVTAVAAATRTLWLKNDSNCIMRLDNTSWNKKNWAKNNRASQKEKRNSNTSKNKHVTMGHQHKKTRGRTKNTTNNRGSGYGKIFYLCLHDDAQSTRIASSSTSIRCRC